MKQSLTYEKVIIITVLTTFRNKASGLSVLCLCLLRALQHCTKYI